VIVSSALVQVHDVRGWRGLVQRHNLSVIVVNIRRMLGIGASLKSVANGNNEERENKWLLFEVTWRHEDRGGPSRENFQEVSEAVMVKNSVQIRPKKHADQIRSISCTVGPVVHCLLRTDTHLNANPGILV
jgi:hypothetical protein